MWIASTCYRFYGLSVRSIWTADFYECELGLDQVLQLVFELSGMLLGRPFSWDAPGAIAPPRLLYKLLQQIKPVHLMYGATLRAAREEPTGHPRALLEPRTAKKRSEPSKTSPGNVQIPSWHRTVYQEKYQSKTESNRTPLEKQEEKSNNGKLCYTKYSNK